MKLCRIQRTIILNCLFSLIFVFAIMPVTADGPVNSGLSVYTEKVFENGLKLIVKEVRSSPIVAVDIWVGVGARNETPGEAGISHFFEHMLFKGTPTRKPGEIAREIEAVGGYLNAATSLDTTHYYVVVPSNYLDLALEVQADALLNSTFDAVEIERERKVILEEKNLKEDDPKRKLGWLAYREIFAGTPYANDVLGDADTLNNIGREQFLAYHSRYYVPNNMVVTVVGDVDPERVIDKVGTLFKDFKPRKLPREPKIKIAYLTKVKKVALHQRVDQTYLYLGFPGPGMNKAETAALDILGVALGYGKSARLYRSLREEQQIVNEISAGYQSYKSIGMFAVYAQTREADYDKIVSRITTTLKEIAKHGIAAEELAKAKALLRSHIAYATESNADIASILGEYALNGDAADAVKDIIRLEQVTNEQIKQVARKYLTKGYVLTVLLPEEANQE